MVHKGNIMRDKIWHWTKYRVAHETWQLGETLKIVINRWINNFVLRALCSDLVYVILFPQLLMTVHFSEYCNTYGSLFAYCLGKPHGYPLRMRLLRRPLNSENLTI